MKPLDEIILIMGSEMALKDMDATAFRRYINRYYSMIDVPELAKCNKKSAKVRQLGNRLYLEKQFVPALEKYNESICFAEAGSEHLGMGYANRSAIYFEMGEYECALYNIGLAKQNNYPERLMPKLLSRELNCKEMIEGGHSLGIVPNPRWNINVEVNPRIPFLAAGIGMQEYPKMGRGLVAQRDFQVGDVIMVEKPMVVTIDTSIRYMNCNQCGKFYRHSLIPCPTCVSTMYCSVDCLEKDKKFTHRFECAISTKLLDVSQQTSLSGPRMFFYGLTLFNDDLQAMKEYCEQTLDAGGNPFVLDFTKSDPLEEFKELHKAKMRSHQELAEKHEASARAFAAAYYSLLTKHPLVQSIAKTKSLRNFMFDCLLRYTRSMIYLSSTFGFNRQCVNYISSFSSLINHSCDYNVTTIFNSDRSTCAVVRPIRKGDQIVGSLHTAWGYPQPLVTFVCKCAVCSCPSIDHWYRKGLPLPEEAKPYTNLLNDLLQHDTVDRDRERQMLDLVRGYLQRFAHIHPQKEYCKAVHAYRKLVNSLVDQEAVIRDRAQAARQLA